MSLLTLSQVIKDMEWFTHQQECEDKDTLKLWIRSLKHHELNDQPYRVPEGPRHDMGQ